MDFANVTNITIPEGNVVKIHETNSGRVLWQKKDTPSYPITEQHFSTLSRGGEIIDFLWGRGSGELLDFAFNNLAQRYLLPDRPLLISGDKIKYWKYNGPSYFTTYENIKENFPNYCEEEGINVSWTYSGNYYINIAPIAIDTTNGEIYEIDKSQISGNLPLYIHSPDMLALDSPLVEFLSSNSTVEIIINEQNINKVQNKMHDLIGSVDNTIIGNAFLQMTLQFSNCPSSLKNPEFNSPGTGFFLFYY